MFKGEEKKQWEILVSTKYGKAHRCNSEKANGFEKKHTKFMVCLRLHFTGYLCMIWQSLTFAGTKIGHLTILCTGVEVELVKYCLAMEENFFGLRTNIS